MLSKFCKPIIDNELTKNSWDHHLASFTKREVDKLGLGYTDQSQILMYNFGACRGVSLRVRDWPRAVYVKFHMG